MEVGYDGNKKRFSKVRVPTFPMGEDSESLGRVESPKYYQSWREVDNMIENRELREVREV